MAFHESPGNEVDSFRSELVGRDHEFGQLHQALQLATRGSGRLILISGEAGIGKTSLTQALTQEAIQAGALVLSGAAYDLSSTPPFGPWLELADRYRPTSKQPESPEWLSREAIANSGTSSEERFQEMQSFLINLSAQQPVLLVLEDLHWADENSLDLLRYLARSISGRALLIVATYRDEELSREDPLYLRIPVLVRESMADRIELSPLDRSEISDLVRARYDLPAHSSDRLIGHLMKLTDGNPLFAVELLRTLERDGVLKQHDGGWMIDEIPDRTVPSLIQQMVEQRMTSLSEQARQTVQKASVYGSVIPINIWEQIAPEGKAFSVAEEALDANLLVESPSTSGLSFRHALIREVIHASLPLLSRRMVHLEVAEILLTAASPDADEVAYHLHHAGDARAWGWLIRSGLRARDADAWLIAAERFEQAARMVESIPEYTRARGWLLFYAAYLMRYAPLMRNIDLLGESLQAAVDSSDSLLRGYVLYHRGAARAMRNDVRHGVEEIELGVQQLEELARHQYVGATETYSRAVLESLLEGEDYRPGPVSAETGRLPVFQRGVLINWLAQSGQYVRASQMGEHYSQAISELNVEDQIHPSWILGLAHAAGALGQIDAAANRYSRALHRFYEIGDYHMVEYAGWANLIMLTIPYLTDDSRERERLVHECDQAAQRASFISGVNSRMCGTLNDYLNGNLESAYESCSLVIHTSKNSAIVENASVTLADIHLLRGEYDRVWNLLKEITPEGPETPPGNNYFAAAIQAHRIAARTLLRTGEAETARRWLESRDHWLQWSGAILWNAEQQLLWAEYFRSVGDTEQAATLAERALHTAREPRQPLSLLQVHRLSAELAMCVDDLTTADTHAGEAATLAAECDIAYELACTQLVQAELELRRDNQQEAHSLLKSAGSRFERMGARPELERIEQLLRSNRDSSSARPWSLSKRELEVLHLLTEGRSDREIAETLFISHHTAMRHVSSILRKLGVESRTSAAALAVRENIF